MKIRSMEQFEKKYLPELYEKKKRDKMSPGELGRYLASKSLKRAFRK